jgi:hypothetical protein
MFEIKVPNNFPSWTSRVRVSSLAPWFQQLAGNSDIQIAVLPAENWE